MVKNIFDFVLSLLGLIILSPILVLVAILIKLDSHGPVFYHSRRVGKNWLSFTMYKFRTMVNNAEEIGPHITSRTDHRITHIGKILRKTKIDELPNLINIFKGEMSFVGPRPELIKFVELYAKEYKEILSVKPGITDIASIKFKDESSLLESNCNVEENYADQILPEKIKYNLEYVRKRNLFGDLALIEKTLLVLFRKR